MVCNSGIQEDKEIGKVVVDDIFGWNKNLYKELIDKDDKEKLLKRYDNLKCNVDNLIRYDLNKFNVEDVIFSRDSIIKGNKKDVENIRDNIENSRNSFVNKIKDIFISLESRYNELKKNVVKDKSFRCGYIEDTVNLITKFIQDNKDIEDNEISNVIENIKKLDVLVNNLDVFIKGGISSLKKQIFINLEKLKDKFEFGKNNIKDFKYDLDDNINIVNSLDNIQDLQNLEREINEEDKKINNFINDKLKDYKKRLKNLKNRYKDLVNSLQKVFSSIFTKEEVYSYIDDYEIMNYNIPDVISYYNIKEIDDKLVIFNSICNDFKEEYNLTKCIDDWFKKKTSHIHELVVNNIDKDINIIKLLLIVTLFKKKIDHLDTDFYSIFEKFDSDEKMDEYENLDDDNKFKTFKNTLLDICKICFSFCNSKMDKDKTYIYNYGINSIKFFKATNDTEILSKKFKKKCSFICKDHDYNDQIKNKKCIYSCDLEDKYFDIYIKKDDTGYNNIVFYDFNAYGKQSYLCYCIPGKNSFYFIKPDDYKNFNGLFRYYNVEEIKILCNSPYVTTMNNMFSNCTNLKKLDLSNLKTSNVTDMSSMFKNCKNLEEIIFGDNFDTSNVTNMKEMFYNCENIKRLDLNNFNTYNVTDMSNMFNNCKNIEEIIFGDNFSTANVINMDNMFKDCEKIKKLDLCNFDTSKVETMSRIFKKCKDLKEILFGNNFNLSKVTNMTEMFYNCENIKTLDINFSSSNVVNMSKMFYNCSSLKTLDLSNFDTSKVTNMEELFCNCSNLNTLKLNNFNTSNVVNMSKMFYNCSSLETLDLSNFDTSNTKNMGNMFENCINLKSLKLGNFNTSNVINMFKMFYNCENLDTLDVSKFNLSNKFLNVEKMFYNCKKINKDSIKNIFSKFEKYDEKKIFGTK